MSAAYDLEPQFRHIRVVVSVIVCLTLVAGCRSVPDPDSVQIRRGRSAYIVKPPNSKVSLRIPRGRLLRKAFRPDGEAYGPNYFHFEEDEINLVVSGTFRPAKVFPGAKILWECQVLEWTSKDLPIPQDVIFEDIDNWHTVICDLTTPDAYGAHLRAHRLKKGIWIDLHLSMTSDQKEMGAKSRLLSLLRRMRVEVAEPPTRGHGFSRNRQKKRR